MPTYAPEPKREEQQTHAPSDLESPAPVQRRSELRGMTYEEGSAAMRPTPTAGLSGVVQMDQDPQAQTVDPEKEKEKKEQERVAAAKASWEKILGETIGGKLFDLIREHLSMEDLQGYATDGVDAIAKALPDVAKEPTGEGELAGLMDEKAEAEALTKFLAVLTPTLEKGSKKWLESDKAKKILVSISQWVEENPGWVLTIIGTAAIGAAVGAYLANMDAPMIEQTFKLGDSGWSLGGGIDIGPIQQIAVQAASLSVAYASENLAASLKGTYEDDGKEDPTRSYGLEGSLKSGDSLTLLAKGKITEGPNGLVIHSGSTSLTLVDPQTGSKFVLGADGKFSTDGSSESGWSATINNKTASDGGATADISIAGRQITIVGEDGTVVRTDKTSFKMAVGNAAGKFSLEMSGQQSSDGKSSSTLTASGEGTLDGGSTISGTGTLTTADDGSSVLTMDGGFKSKVAGTPIDLGLGMRSASGDSSETVTSLTGRAAIGDEGEQTTFEGSYDLSTDVFSLTLGRTALDGAYKSSSTLARDEGGGLTQTDTYGYSADGTSFGMTDQVGPDGTGQKVSLGFMGVGGIPGLSLDGSYGVGTLDSYSLGAGYKSDFLTSELDLAMKDGVTTLGLSSSVTSPTGFTGKFDFKSDLSAGRFDSMAVSFGFRDPKLFRTFMFDYSSTWVPDNEDYKHHFGTLLEYSAGKLSGRFEGGVDLMGGGVSGTRADLLMGYQVAPDWALLGSGTHTSTMVDGSLDGSWQAGVGVQYKGVALMGTYDFSTEQLGLGLVIPLSFGSR